MKAYEATFEKNGSNPTTVLVGANSLSAAAKKAEDLENTSSLNLVKVELTDKIVI